MRSRNVVRVKPATSAIASSTIDVQHLVVDDFDRNSRPSNWLQSVNKDSVGSLQIVVPKLDRTHLEAREEQSRKPVELVGIQTKRGAIHYRQASIRNRGDEVMRSACGSAVGDGNWLSSSDSHSRYRVVVALVEAARIDAAFGYLKVCDPLALRHNKEDYER